MDIEKNFTTQPQTTAQVSNPPFVESAVLEGHGVKLVPLGFQHEQGLAAAAADGELWKLVVTSVPEPENTHSYIEKALTMRAQGTRFAFAVLDPNSGTVLGSTSYHDIIAEARRVEIGYTWYAQCMQKTYVNTACKFVLMSHAFETLKCSVVGWRTDISNVVSQKAIERLGAKKDGVIRCNALRKDGTIRDTVMYSMTADEWPEAKTHLQTLMNKYK